MRRFSILAFAVTALMPLGLGACSDDDSASLAGFEGAHNPGRGGPLGEPLGEGGASGVDEGGGGEGGGGYAAAGASGAAGEAGEPNKGDKFEPVGTNPFVMTAHDPLSTFAADVDTASYDIFRRDINRGSLPIPASVRLEEYVNYFRYDYAAPSSEDEHPFEISLAAAPHLLSRGSTLLRVGIQAMLPSPFEKKPVNLVFLIDTSGSMSSSDKLDLVKYTVTEALDVLEPSDTVSLVTYASGTSVRLEPTPVSSRTIVQRAIDELEAGGSTNGAGGLGLAYAQAEEGFIEGGINHVVLCTDGDFNVGPSSTEDLVDLIVEKRKSGITLTVLGYGVGNLNDSMMEAISNKGNGVYGVISDEDQATAYVNQRLLSSIEHVAKDMKIQVEFNPELVHAYRLLGYENRDIADDDFRDDAIDAGEVGAGHRVTALYEIVPVGSELPAPKSGAPLLDDGPAFDGAREVGAEDWVLVKVRYKDVDATETDPAYEVSESMKPGDAVPAFVNSDGDLQWAIAMAAFAEILKKSPYADPGHLEIIGNVARAQAEFDADRAEFEQLFETARGLLEEPE